MLAYKGVSVPYEPSRHNICSICSGYDMVRGKKYARAVMIVETNLIACALKLMIRRSTPRHLAGRGESASPVEQWLLDKQVRGNNMDDKGLECSAPKASVSKNESTKRRASLTGTSKHFFSRYGIRYRSQSPISHSEKARSNSNSPGVITQSLVLYCFLCLLHVVSCAMSSNSYVLS